MDDELTEEEQTFTGAIDWLVNIKQGVSLDCFGGYFGPVYFYQDLVLLVDPGHESQKYASLDCWKKEDVISIYQKHKDDEKDDEYMYEEVLDELAEKRVPLETA